MQVYEGVKVELLAFLILEIEESESSASRPGHLNSGDRTPNTCFIGGWSVSEPVWMLRRGGKSVTPAANLSTISRSPNLLPNYYTNHALSCPALYIYIYIYIYIYVAESCYIRLYFLSYSRCSHFY